MCLCRGDRGGGGSVRGCLYFSGFFLFPYWEGNTPTWKTSDYSWRNKRDGIRWCGMRTISEYSDPWSKWKWTEKLPSCVCVCVCVCVCTHVCVCMRTHRSRLSILPSSANAQDHLSSIFHKRSLRVSPEVGGMRSQTCVHEIWEPFPQEPSFRMKLHKCSALSLVLTLKNKITERRFGGEMFFLASFRASLRHDSLAG